MQAISSAAPDQAQIGLINNQLAGIGVACGVALGALLLFCLCRCLSRLLRYSYNSVENSQNIPPEEPLIYPGYGGSYL